MGIVENVDPNGLLEYSVVFTDRSLNSMSKSFQQVIRDISAGMKEVYQAEACVLIPGGGTFAMEAIARQFGGGQDCLVVRNGWFSYRWSEIFEKGGFAKRTKVMCAGQTGAVSGQNSYKPFLPAAIEEVVAEIKSFQPGLVCAPHVETSAGMMLPDDYIQAIADAAHEAGALFVLDCVASGALFVDMAKLGVDILLTAPQKGWTSTPCTGVVMLGSRAVAKLADTNSSSYVCDVAKWHAIMQAYENGGHAYHATMPTDGLVTFRDAIAETRAFGFEQARQAQIELGRQMRALMESHGFVSVAAKGFQAPSVIVSFTNDPEMKSGKKFMQQGVQIAAGVPLQVGEGEEYMSFRIGLFGLDKLMNIDRTVSLFEKALTQVETA